MMGELAVKYDERPVLPKINIPVLAVMTENNRSQRTLLPLRCPAPRQKYSQMPAIASSWMTPTDLTPCLKPL